MAQPKIFTVQPRFTLGDTPNAWSLIDGIFRFGDDIPPYGTAFRDAYLAVAWFNEPMTAGAFSTWIEKAQTLNWKITGGRNNATYYANLLQQADGGAGWTYHEGVCALDYLVTDKGAMEELGRSTLNDDMLKKLQKFLSSKSISSDLASLASYVGQTSFNARELELLVNKATAGRVTGIQHLDSARMVKYGYPGMKWRYFPELRQPIFVPDNNLIHISSMPSGRDRYRGFGHCALTRLLDAKSLMLGYLNYFRQEVGDLPPELIAIINGLPATAVADSLRKYREDKKARGHDEYGKIWWLGSDDPMTPVSFETRTLTSPTKSFDYKSMVEWWIKLLALNTGEDVGEFWLLQSGESKTVQSIQAQKTKGKGVANYLQEKERKYNLEIMPFEVRFEYDNVDDEADAARADIIARKVGTLATLAKIGVEREEPVFTLEEIKEFAAHWELLPPEMLGEDVPKVIGAALKQVSQETWTIHKDGREYRNTPILRSDKDIAQASFVYKALKETYTPNGKLMAHKPVEDPVL